MSRKIDLGAISAYAIAVENGFEGTEAQWLASLKGNKGDKGNIGNTPVISANAEVAQTTGTPTVEVNQSGTAENPILNFSFSGLKGDKGDKGDDGLDGFSARLPQAEYNPSDSLIVDDGTDAKKISVKDFVDNGTKDIWKVQGELGVKNLLPYPYSQILPKTIGGITFSDEGEGKIGVSSGTASTYSSYDLCNEYSKLILPVGDYIVSCNSEEAFFENTQYFLITYKKSPSVGGVSLASCRASVPEVRFSITQEIYDNIINGDGYLLIRLVYEENSVINNDVVFKPMIRSAKYKDASWGPYAKSNRELTEDIMALNKTNFKLPNLNQDANIPYDNNTFNVAEYDSQSPNLPSAKIHEVMTFQSVNNSIQLALGRTEGTIYIRRNQNGTWKPWKRFITEDELTTLEARVTALENK